MTSNRDLRKFQDDESIQEAFGKLVSGGKPGYKTVIDKNKPIPKCDKCKTNLLGDEKFCPECGEKINQN